MVCERCGFEPEHTCQLDVLDHLDETESPVIVCANCHALAVYERRPLIARLIESVARRARR